MTIPGRDPRDVQLAAGLEPGGGRADFKGGRRGRHFRGTCSGGRSSFRAPGIRPRRERRFSRPRRREAWPRP